MIPFRVAFRPGVPLFEQVVYAATKAMVSGQMRAGDAFPSVRALSKELKINPNTAHKVVAHLVSAGLLETRPGMGTVVAAMPDATAKQRMRLLEQEIEQVVVQAKRLGIRREEMIDAVNEHWRRLSATEHEGVGKAKDGGRRER